MQTIPSFKLQVFIMCTFWFQMCLLGWKHPRICYPFTGVNGKMYLFKMIILFPFNWRYLQYYCVWEPLFTVSETQKTVNTRNISGNDLFFWSQEILANQSWERKRLLAHSVSMRPFVREVLSSIPIRDLKTFINFFPFHVALCFSTILRVFKARVKWTHCRSQVLLRVTDIK